MWLQGEEVGKKKVKSSEAGNYSDFVLIMTSFYGSLPHVLTHVLTSEAVI